MKTLFPDQQETLDRVRDSFRRGNRSVLLVAPPGFGKTIIGAEVVRGAAERKNSSWFLNHRRELIHQTSKSFYEQGIEHGTVIAGSVGDPDMLIQVASVQTIVRRLDKFRSPDLILPDECHHVASKTWSKILDENPESKVLGLTGTPWRLDGKGLGHWFDDMVEGPSTRWLIDNGRLTPFRLFAPYLPDMSGVKTLAGDYEKSSLAAAMDKPSITGDAVAHYQKLASGKRFIAFCCSIEHSKHVAAQFNASGIPTVHVDGYMSDDERDRAFEMFRSGEVLGITNVDLVGEGVDVPALECVILLRPTKSMSNYLQSSMRPMRVADGKADCIILDHAGNSLIHGLPDDDREWSLDDREKKKRAAPSEVPIRQCKECFYVYRPAPRCPQCGHAAPAAPRIVETVEGTLEEVRRVEAVAKAKKRQEQGSAQTLEDLQRIGRERGYRSGWAMNIWNARQRRAA